MTRSPYGTGWVPYGLVVVAVVAVLLAVAASVRRSPVASVPDRDGYFADWSGLHGGARPTGIVGWWLSGVYRLARPLVRLGVDPSVLTAGGLVVAAAVPCLAEVGPRWPILAGLVVALSAVLDNLDGAVAVMARRTSAWGFVLDSLVDRVSDGAYLVAFWLLGAAGWLCVLAGSALTLLEYARARAGNAGMTEIGVVTVGERPTRVIIASSFLITAGIFCAHPAGISAAAVLGTGVVSLVGLVQLLIVVRRTLLRQRL
jgi:CDP-diacylglycerol--glycerol-3-phosphate 3-phosphatidyltransferase